MSYLNKNSLPSYLYSQDISDPVLFESKLCDVMESILVRYKYKMSNSIFSWVDFVNNSSYNGYLGISSSNKFLGNNINIRGNGNVYNITFELSIYSIVISYDNTTGIFTFSGVPSEYKVCLPNTSVLLYIETFDFAVSLYSAFMGYISNFIEKITYTKYLGINFIPDVYQNSIPNVVESSLLTEISDVESFEMNSWTNIKTLQTEFNFSAIFGTDSPIYNIVEPSLLKSLFSIKGSESGLRFLLKYFGMEVIVYYYDDIMELGIGTQLVEEVTNCDIVIDLTLGQKMSLGVNPITHQIDNNYGDAMFNALVMNVMSVCLNVIGFIFTKIFEDQWIGYDSNGVPLNNNKFDSTYEADQEETFSNIYSYRVAKDSLVCDKTTNDPYFPITYYGDPVTYGSGYVYYPTKNPIDFGLKWGINCTWYSPSKIDNVEFEESFISKACRYENLTYGLEYLKYNNNTPYTYKNNNSCDISYTDKTDYTIDYEYDELVNHSDLIQNVGLEIAQYTHYRNLYTNANSFLYNNNTHAVYSTGMSDSVNVIIEE